MDDPHVILGIDRHANGLAEDPVIGQRLGPGEIDFEMRRRDVGGLHGECQESDARRRSAFHGNYYTLRPARGAKIPALSFPSIDMPNLNAILIRSSVFQLIHLRRAGALMIGGLALFTG